MTTSRRVLLALCLPFLLAQLENTQLASFGGKTGGPIDLEILSNENTLVLCTRLQSLGYSMSQPPREVRVVIANGVTIGGAVPAISTDPANISFATGNCGGTWSTWPVKIIVRGSGTGTIQGHGGIGGTGWRDSGCDHFGSGGGGAGTQGGTSEAATACAGPDLRNQGQPGTASAGGIGGIGEVLNSGSSINITCSGGGVGGTAIQATSGGPNVTLEPESGATLRVWAGGGGGGGADEGETPGGAGGGPGLVGADGADAGDTGARCSGSPGDDRGGLAGAAGVKYSTPGAATITEVGPGTIDDRGN